MRLVRLALASLALVLVTVPASATTGGTTVEFVELSGILDTRMLDFAADAIERAAERGDTAVVVLQIDSPGVVGSQAALDRLVRLVESPPLPVAAWIGPAPARAHGGAAVVALAADLVFAAPGSVIGLRVPAVAGVGEPADTDPLDVSVVPVEDVSSIEVSEATAAPRQVAQLLDGRTVSFVAGERILTTLIDVDGGATVDVVIRQPGWWDGFLRLASTPEAAFFLLVAGLTVAAFEFYAIGPGLAAGVAALCLFLASYGLAVLPVRWWAVAVVVVAIWVLTVSFQRGGVVAFTAPALVALVVAGFAYTDAAPQFSPGAPGVVLTVASAAFLFLLAMPTVARSRFSTQTIGRERLLGRSGIAVSALEPDGVVEVDGARWRASAHRESGIGQGDRVNVTAVDGWWLEVDRVD